MKNEMEPTPTVIAVGRMAFEGHIIPHTWYEHVTYETGGGQEKVDLQAIVILSDIVYWYRPRAVLDEETGTLLRWERRFHGDKLQRNYQQISERFGLSKTQAARAVKRLRDLGLVTMEFRTVETAKGPLPNVLFLEPVPERLAEITHERVRTSSQICKDTPTNLPTYPPKNAKTNTKNTPKNTDKNLTGSPAATGDPEPEENAPSLTEEKHPGNGEAPPATFQGWLALVRDGGNAPAALRLMHETLYPDRAPPDFGYVGKVGRRLGNEVLALRLWELSARPPVGDVLAFAQAMKKNGQQQRQDHNEAILQRFKERHGLVPGGPVLEGEFTVREEVL